MSVGTRADDAVNVLGALAPVSDPQETDPLFCGYNTCLTGQYEEEIVGKQMHGEKVGYVSQLRSELVEHRRRLHALEQALKQVNSKSVGKPLDSNASGQGSANDTPNLETPDQAGSRTDLRHLTDADLRQHERTIGARDLEEGGLLHIKLEKLERDGGVLTSPGTEQEKGKKKKKTNKDGGNSRSPGDTWAPRESHRAAASSGPEERDAAPMASMQRQSVHEGRKIFDQDMLKAIYDKPHKKARQKGAMVGAGVLSIMSMPFGPIGMVGGGMFGALIGSLVGFYLDRAKARREMKESETQRRKLKCLVRWALDHFHEEDQFFKVIEMVTLEFKPVADIADGSKHARKLLKLLDAWIAQKKVTRHLWVYMDVLLQKFNTLSRHDFHRSMLVFQTLSTMYRYSQRLLDEQEIQFLHRMERLLEHESVKLIMNHAQLYPTEGETRLMECMVYADAHAKKAHAKKPDDQGPMSPSRRGDGSDGDDSESDDEDSIISHYTAKGSYLGHRASQQGNLVRAASESSFNQRHGEDHPADSAHESTPGTPLGKDGTPVHGKGQDTPVIKRVLKKPFFRNFSDFMDFENTFKHKMPITLSEFELLRQKAEEPLKGWDVCVDRKEIKVAKTQNDTGCITLRAWATVPGVDINVAFHIFTDHRERVKWDKVFAVMDIVEENVQGSAIVYSLMRVPAVTARDFLQYRRCRLNEDGSIHIVLRSAEHSDMPEQKGVIRAESYCAGYILSQTYEGNTPILNVFLMTCVDIKGLIPKWIINVTAPRKPAEWVESLKKASIDYQKEHPDHKEELVELVKKYAEENPFDYEDIAVEATPEHHEGHAEVPKAPLQTVEESQNYNAFGDLPRGKVETL